MKRSTRVVNWFLRRVFQAVCRIELRHLDRIPPHGPCILVGNHVSFLEVPVAISHIDNPLVTGLAKKESWNNPLFNFLFKQWEVIPIDRDNIDREAFHRSLQALEQGKMLAVFPEGTRSKDGRLLPGKPGVTALAMRCRAPLIPVGFYGYENFWDNLKRLRRTEFTMVVGEPFQLNGNCDFRSKEVRQAVTDEIMFKIAELLPESYRGHYRFDGPVDYRYVVTA